MNDTTANDLEPIERLTFVYKANSGRLNAIIDSARKILRVNGCVLCEITHGLSGKKRDWHQCEMKLGVPVELTFRTQRA